MRPTVVAGIGLSLLSSRYEEYYLYKRLSSVQWLKNNYFSLSKKNVLLTSVDLKRDFSDLISTF